MTLERCDVCRKLAASLLENLDELRAELEHERHEKETVAESGQAMVRYLTAERDALRADQERHLLRANEEIARRAQAEIAFTQSEQKRLGLIDRVEKAETERDALRAEGVQLRAALASIITDLERAPYDVSQVAYLNAKAVLAPPAEQEG